jgi:hypothetical protein
VYHTGDVGRLVNYRAFRKQVAGGDAGGDEDEVAEVVLELLGRRDAQVKVTDASRKLERLGRG